MYHHSSVVNAFTLFYYTNKMASLIEKKIATKKNDSCKSIFFTKREESYYNMHIYIRPVYVTMERFSTVNKIRVKITSRPA